MNYPLLQSPLVSIIMNCFNGERFIADAIISVLNQTYNNWELIFWDNCSTDFTKNVVQKFSDSRIKYFLSPEFTTLYDARNRAISFSSGELITFLDVDDLWEGGKLASQVALFEASPDTGVIFSNYYISNCALNTKKIALSNITLNENLQLQLLNNYFIGILTVMMRRNLFSLDKFCFNPRYTIIGDFDFFVRLSSFVQFKFINLPLATYRIHGDNEGIRNKLQYFKEIEIWCENAKLISPNLNLTHILNIARYGMACHFISNGSRVEALNIFFHLPLSFFKLKLAIKLLLPI